MFSLKFTDPSVKMNKTLEEQSNIKYKYNIKKEDE